MSHNNLYIHQREPSPMRKTIVFVTTAVSIPATLAATNVSLQLGVEQINSSSSFSWLFLLLIFLVLAAAGYYLYRILKQKIPANSAPVEKVAAPITLQSVQAESSRKAPEKTITELPQEIEKYLKEDERIVLRVLQMKGGSAGQGTLRIATNFSKAKLSRVLAELEQRGVIHKDKEGKKNLVSIR